jgi:hypothetical protein
MNTQNRISSMILRILSDDPRLLEEAWLHLETDLLLLLRMNSGQFTISLSFFIFRFCRDQDQSSGRSHTILIGPWDLLGFGMHHVVSAISLMSPDASSTLSSPCSWINVQKNEKRWPRKKLIKPFFLKKKIYHWGSNRVFWVVGNLLSLHSMCSVWHVSIKLTSRDLVDMVLESY